MTENEVQKNGCTTRHKAHEPNHNTETQQHTMPVSHHIDLSLEFQEQPYQPGDTIKGLLHAHFEDDIRVKNIQVGIHGRAHTYMRVHNGNNNYSTYQESHVLVYDVCTVFPPVEYDKVMASEEYGVNAGDTLTHPFELRLPLNAFCCDSEEVERSNAVVSEREKRFLKNVRVEYAGNGAHMAQGGVLPNTFLRQGMAHEGRASVKYEILVIVNKASTFSINSHITVPFEVQRPVVATPMYTQVITSDVITVKKKRDNGVEKGWFSRHVTDRPEKVAVQFKTVVLFPDVFKGGLEFKPLVYLVSDMDPGMFMENYDEKSEKKTTGVSTGLGEVWLINNKLSVFAQLNMRASIRKQNHAERKPESIIGSSSTPQMIDLCQLRPIGELGDLVLQQSCTEKYAMDISQFFGQGGVIPQLESPVYFCNIEYGHWVEVTMKWAGRASGYGLSRQHITLLDKTIVSI